MKTKKSSKPKKQRKFHYEKAMHKKQQGLSTHLNKKLRQQLGNRNLCIRKGDSVKVLRGAKKGSSGKITGVNYKKGTVFVEKLARKKASGEEIPLPVHASNLLLIDVDKSDAKRFKGKKLWKETEETKKEKEKPENKAKEKEKKAKEEKGREKKQKKTEKGEKKGGHS